MDLFVYGTLQSAGLMRAVAGGTSTAPFTASLPGYEIKPLKNNVVPYIVASADHTAEGLVFPGLTDDQCTRLNTYEGAFGYTLQTVEVSSSSGTTQVQCYLPSETYETSDGQWSFKHWQRDHEAPAILAAQELFNHDPLPDYAALRRMWPMMESRAWAKQRAQTKPAQYRYAPSDQDMQIHKMASPTGSFFRLQGIDVSHKLFQGGYSDQLPREVFMGVDAVIVLPYDPVRDKVLLVEQFRNGPLLRHDPLRCSKWRGFPHSQMLFAERLRTGGRPEGT